MDPRDVLHLFVAGAVGGDGFPLFESHDGGKSWKQIPLPCRVCDDKASPFVGDPEVATTEDGSVLVKGMISKFPYRAIGVWRSGDGGATFSEPVVLSSDQVVTSTCEFGIPCSDTTPLVVVRTGADPYEMTASPGGRVIVTWTEQVGAQVISHMGPDQYTPERLQQFASISLDSGRTWSGPTKVADGVSGPGQTVYAGGIGTFLTDGTPLLLLGHGDRTALASSHDQGKSWTIGPDLPPDIIIEGSERLFTDAKDRLVYVGTDHAGQYPAPAAWRSIDHGEHWSAPIILDTPEANTTPTMDGPAIRTMALSAPDGVYVGFYHAKAEGPWAYDIARLPDDGTAPFPLVLDANAGGHEYAGDEYSGLALGPAGQVFAVWSHGFLHDYTTWGAIICPKSCPVP